MAQHVNVKDIENTFERLVDEYAGTRFLSGIYVAKTWMEHLESVEAEPVSHGHWIPHKMIVRSPFAKNYDCSECGRENFYYPSCPYCRAKMDGKE